MLKGMLGICIQYVGVIESGSASLVMVPLPWLIFSLSHFFQLSDFFFFCKTAVLPGLHTA